MARSWRRCCCWPGSTALALWRRPLDPAAIALDAA